MRSMEAMYLVSGSSTFTPVVGSKYVNLRTMMCANARFSCARSKSTCCTYFLRSSAISWGSRFTVATVISRRMMSV